MNAICSACKNLSNLEVCFECKYTLCGECIKKHYESWKEKANIQFLVQEKNIELYKKRIGKNG